MKRYVSSVEILFSSGHTPSIQKTAWSRTETSFTECALRPRKRMADLVAWAQSAKQRLKKYQKDRGITDRNRPRAGRIRGLVPDERGAGRELSPMADQVPPV